MIKRIVSGWQTGADRAGLDVAIALGIDYGGWIPAGRRAEDGRVPDRYQMTEAASRDYLERTCLNVIDSDATLILYFDSHRSKWGGLTGGTKRTLEMVHEEKRRVYVADPLTGHKHDRGPEDVRRWLDRYPIEVLNIAGPRESKQPGIYAASYAFLMRVLGGVK